MVFDHFFGVKDICKLCGKNQRSLGYERLSKKVGQKTLTKVNSLNEPVEGSWEQKLFSQLLNVARLWLAPLLGKLPCHWLSGEKHRGSHSSTLCEGHGQNRLTSGKNLVHFGVKWYCLRNMVQKLLHLAIVGAGARGTGSIVVKLGWLYAYDDRISLSLLGQKTFDRPWGSHGGMWWF